MVLLARILPFIIVESWSFDPRETPLCVLQAYLPFAYRGLEERSLGLRVSRRTPGLRQ